jgi:hypothetical protein
VRRALSSPARAERVQELRAGFAGGCNSRARGRFCVTPHSTLEQLARRRGCVTPLRSD